MSYKVSVIVPVYNAEEYLEKCIESILSQTLRNIEIILINDGSKDSSGSICEKYKEIDERINVIHIENAGVSNARNIGIKNSTGEYIVFCDSDDYVNKKWCEKLYNSARMNPECMVVCGINIHNQRKKCNIIEKLIINSNENISYINKSDFYILFKNNIFNGPCNKIFQRDILIKNNIRYDVNLSLGEDMLFNLEYLNKIKDKIIVLNECLYNYILTDKESLDNKYYTNLFDIYDRLYSELYKSMKINKCDMNIYEKLYWKNYFYMIEKSLLNTFSKKNKDSLIKKLKYNNKIMKSRQFTTSISYISDEDINRVYLRLLKTKNYILPCLFNKLVKIKYEFTKK